MSLTRASLRRRGPGRRLQFDLLEARRVLCGENCLEVPLVPDFDQFGSQIETVMGYKAPGEADEQARISFALYDTGASVVTVSHTDQALFELLPEGIIPIKVPGGATADAIGGELIGDVSFPGEIIADGLHALNLTGDLLEMGIDFAAAARTPGVQVFVGDDFGSPMLPTITGTVIHEPSPTHPNGTAAWIDMTAFHFDFGELFPEIPEFADIVIDLPDLRFVEPGLELTAPTDGSVSQIVRVPLEMWGESNYADPGDMISYSTNPVQPDTSFSMGGITSGGHTMLFDTGAQLTVISTDIALELGLNLDSPNTSITVQGAAGTVDIPGFTIDALEVPRDDDGDGVIDGVLRFTSVPIYVLDVVPGLDGIIGMNLFNLAHSMLYDPHDPNGASLQVAFFTDLVRELPPLPDSEEGQAIDFLTAAFPALSGSFGGQNLPSFGLEVPLPNQPPTNIALARTDVFAATPGAWIGGVRTSDADTADTHTYELSDARFEMRGSELFLKPGVALSDSAGSLINLRITATDSGTPAESFSRDFTLTVRARPDAWDHAWQWAPRRHDVNLDGIVTPLDALLVINELNAFGPRTLPIRLGGTLPGPFYDVSGDDVISAQDALEVINYLNAGGSGEAEEEAAEASDAALLALMLALDDEED